MNSRLISLFLAAIMLIVDLPPAAPITAATRYGDLAALTAVQATPPQLTNFPGACGLPANQPANRRIFLPLIASSGGARAAVAPDSAADPQSAPAADTQATDSAADATTAFAASVAFLHSGPNPTQIDVAQNAIDPERAAVVRGRVINRAGEPLPEVTIAVLNHPDYGQTRTDADGSFNLTVNGGPQVTLCFEKTGYLPAQRAVTPPWNGYAWVDDDVALVPINDQVTQVDLTSNAAIQAVQSSAVTDADGTRQATFFFSRGTRAELVFPDGRTEATTTLSVRATEYTVGENGPQAMPGLLPPASQYTYAAAFTADEALQAGATEVRFSQPVPFYLENFLDFPAGTVVPVGFYDRDRGVWEPADDGRVIAILSVSSGFAVLDVDGSGQPASAAELAELGISEAERAQLGVLYRSGQSLWRTPIRHFSDPDCNWSGTPPDDATGPNGPPPDNGGPRRCNTSRNGSIIECESQSLGERIAVAGTPFTLNYRSRNTPGYAAARTLNIPLSGETVPASLRRIRLVVTVAGQRIVRTYPGTPEQRATITWDGRDAFGRPVTGTQRASVRIGFVYAAVYTETEPGAFGRAFGRYGTATLEGNIAREEITIWQQYDVTLERRDARDQGLGGWTLSPHHQYDPTTSLLRMGDGERAEIDPVGGIATVAGNGSNAEALSNNGRQAVEAALFAPTDLDLAPDGSLYIATSRCTLWQVRPNGTLNWIAGRAGCGISNEEGVPARNVLLINVNGLDIAPDGSIYFVESGSIPRQGFVARARRISPDGIITTIAGDPQRDPNDIGDGGPARDAYLETPQDIAVAPDGNIYIAENQTNRVRLVTPDGMISTYAGGGEVTDDLGDGGPAAEAALGRVQSIAVGPDNSLYIAHEAAGNSRARIRKVDPQGIISTVAGPTRDPFAPPGQPEGEPATAVRIDSVGDMEITADGSIYFSERVANSIYRITPDGILRRVAGRGYEANPPARFSEDGTPPLEAFLDRPTGIALAPDGTFYLSDNNNSRVRKVGPGGIVGRATGSDEPIRVSSADGRELYTFDPNGRHLRTQDALFGSTIYTFAYDSAGRLASISDGDGNTTTIERDDNDRPTAIVAPYGQRTTLGMNDNGYLASIANPANEAHRASYSANGLLAMFRQPGGAEGSFSYDDLGRLQRDDIAGPQALDLSLSERADGFTVTVTDAGGQATSYSSTQSAAGEEWALTTPDGVTSTSTRNGDTVTSLRASGARATVRSAPDARLGFTRPASVSLRTPAGLERSTELSHSFDLADPGDPFSLQILTTERTLNGLRSTTVYNATERSLTSTSPEGRITRWRYDEQGRLAVVEPADRAVSRNSYDERGRLIQITVGEGDTARTTTFTYTSGGQIATVRDPLQRELTLSYDEAGRLSGARLPDGEQASVRYTPDGRIAALITPNGDEHSFSYDERGNMTSYTPPGATAPAIQRNYDAANRLDLVRYPDGSSSDLGYNELGQLTSLVDPRGTTSYTYDPNTGQLSQINAPDNITLSLSYDGPLPTRQTWAGPVAGNVEWRYDNFMRQNMLLVNSATPIRLSYDDDGMLTQAGDLSLTRAPASGLLSSASLGSVSDSYTYNDFGALASYTSSTGGNQRAAMQYSYDVLGRMSQIVETINGVTTTFDYTYDLQGRLSSVRRNGVEIERYGYDANGNRTSATVNGVSASGDYNGQDQLTSYGGATYAYDARGALRTRTAGGQVTTYTYDPLANLTAVTLPDDTSIEYLIDGANRRIGKRVNGSLVQSFLYQDRLRPIAELDGAGNVVSRFIYSEPTGAPSYMLRGGVAYRIVRDHLGSPRLVINSATGEIVQRLDYDTWGNVLADSNPGFQPFGLAGGLYDADTGLVRFGARDYDPQTGRWTSRDQALLAGLQTNFYAYVFNDPLNLIDPQGRNPAAPAAGSGALVAMAALFAVGLTLQTLMSTNPQLVNDAAAELANLTGQTADAVMASLEALAAAGEIDNLIDWIEDLIDSLDGADPDLFPIDVPVVPTPWDNDPSDDPDWWHEAPTRPDHRFPFPRPAQRCI